MDSNYYRGKEERWSEKLIVFIQEIWPSLYRMFNDLFFGTIHFILDTLSGLWRR